MATGLSLKAHQNRGTHFQSHLEVHIDCFIIIVIIIEEMFVLTQASFSRSLREFL